jgi:hypothetical protein
MKDGEVQVEESVGGGEAGDETLYLQKVGNLFYVQSR